MKKNYRYKSNLKSSFSLVGMSSVVMCIILFSVFQFVFMDDIFALASRISMLDVADKIQQIDFSDDKYPAVLSEYERENNFYIEIYSPRDTLIYTSQTNETAFDQFPDKNENTVLKPRIMRLVSQKLRKDGSYFEVREESYTSAQYIVYGSFFSEDMGLELYGSVDDIRENARVASWALFVLSIVSLLVFFGTTYYYATLFTNPLRRIIKTTKKIAGLDFNESCPSFKIKELDELSENINILSTTLDGALTQLKTENRQLEIDIETERKLDKTRRTFVANVSHELKTPIAIIQGYAEGMKYGVGCDSTEEFCDIIIEESQKMNSLVVKTLELMQYSSSNMQLNKSEFNIAELVSDCVHNHILQINEAGIRVDALGVASDAEAYADRELIAIVLNNYLSNAVSHIDHDRIITVKACDIGESYRVSVINTGNPIPGTDLENIWQSFYRGDKSHSRKEGRFGLGLSIVSTLQELHGEKYGVINGDKSVEFWFDVKKCK